MGLTMSAPNFIYIGPDKAGSSWLHEVLLTHPQVFMPAAKDLYFFDRYYDRGRDWYLGQFADATAQHQVVGEVCQDYLFEPLAPQRIHETLGPIRMMVTLRDPADRAFSSYLYMLKQGQSPGTFLEALESRPELLEHGRYATGLGRFREVFGAGAVFVGVFDDFVDDPQGYVDRLLTWLAHRAAAPQRRAAGGPAPGCAGPLARAVPARPLVGRRRPREARRGQPDRTRQAVDAGPARCSTSRSATTSRR